MVKNRTRKHYIFRDRRFDVTNKYRNEDMDINSSKIH